MNRKTYIAGISTALAATLIIVLLALKMDGIYPFGDKLLVYHDMEYQYVDFFMWLKRVFAGQENLEYSFNFGLGGNTIAMYAYYLASPLNLLMTFCPAAAMGQGLTVLIVVKFLLCAVTAWIYLKKRFDIQPVFMTILSVGYALMGYNILHCSNVMWLDGVIILPILSLGIYRLVWFRKRNVYFAALFYGIFSNWYIGYMICIFAVFYFVFETVLYKYAENVRSKRLWMNFIEFGITSLLSVMATALLFYPQTLYMMQEGESFDWTVFEPAYNFSLLGGFRDLALEADKLTFRAGYPPVYIGTAPVIMVIAMFISKKTPVFRKVLSGAFLAGVMCLFMYRPLYYIFTVLKVPSNHHYRFAFIFSFFFIVIAAMAIKEGILEEKKELLKAALIWVAAILIFDLVESYTDKGLALISVIVALIMGIGLYYYQTANKRYYILLSVVFVVCMMFEFTLKVQLEFEDHVKSAYRYNFYNQRMFEHIDALHEADPSVYRIDKNFGRTDILGNNEGMAYGYSSIAQYSSSNNVKMAEWLCYMGYGNNQTLIDYARILPIDSLLADKYIFSPNSVYGGELIEENVLGIVDIYKNNYALPYAYAVSDDVMELQLETQWEDRLKEKARLQWQLKPEIEEEEAESEDGLELEFQANAFDNHNALYSSLLGKKVDLYTANELVSEKQEGSIGHLWNYEVTASGPVYIYSESGIDYQTMYVNEKRFYKNKWNDSFVMYLGEFEAGDTIKIWIGGDRFYKGMDLDCRTLNMNVMTSALNELRAQSCNDIQLNEKSMSLTYESKGDRLLMVTVPYEKGWSVTVNGENREIKECAGTFMGVKVSDGINHIEFKFHLPGKNRSILASVMSVVIFTVWQMFLRRKENVRVVNSPSGL